MKAVILTRVSSKEQEEGHSLSAQNARLLDYSKRKSLDVIKSFQIIESSTQGNRSKFKEVIKFCEDQNEKIALIADAVDRVQRSFKESVLLDELVRKGKIELHFYREGMIIGEKASATDILRWDFSVMGAKSYVLQSSENIKRSIEHMIRNGEFPGKAPLGYINYRDEYNKSRIKPDDIDGKKVKHLFEVYSLGKSSLKELQHIAEELSLKTKAGKTVPIATLSKVIQNPFYYGEMLVKDKPHRHIYQPLISKELWDRCQEVRLGADKRKPFKYSEKPFLYRGLITCSTTGKICTSELKKGKFNYVVSYDNDGKRKYVPEKDIDEQIMFVLQSFHIPQDLLEVFRSHLKSSKEAEIAYRNQETSTLRTLHTKATDRLDKLFNMYLDNDIDKETYQNKRHDIQIEKDRIEVKLKAHDNADDGFNQLLSELFEIAGNSWDIFRRSSKNEIKRMLLKMIFRTLKLRGEVLEYALNFPFSELQNSISSNLVTASVQFTNFLEQFIKRRDDIMVLKDQVALFKHYLNAA